MTALIIDTSGNEGYVAVAHDGKILETITLSQGRELSKKLFGTIATLVVNKKIDFVATGTGPGTFTGTRVGATTGKTLAYGWGIPLIPFSSSLLPDLEMIADKTHQLFLDGSSASQIELVYISKMP